MVSKIKQMNWEKVNVYLAIAASLFTVVFYLFQIKDSASAIAERVAKLEVKVEHLEQSTSGK